MTTKRFGLGDFAYVALLLAGGAAGAMLVDIIASALATDLPIQTRTAWSPGVPPRSLEISAPGVDTLIIKYAGPDTIWVRELPNGRWCVVYE